MVPVMIKYLIRRSWDDNVTDCELSFGRPSHHSKFTLIIREFCIIVLYITCIPGLNVVAYRCRHGVNRYLKVHLHHQDHAVKSIHCHHYPSPAITIHPLPSLSPQPARLTVLLLLLSHWPQQKEQLGVRYAWFPTTTA